MKNKQPCPAYDQDHYGWSLATAELLRQGRYNEVDMNHVIEEIEEMGVSNEHQLINRLGVLVAHLLKWHYHPENRSRSWSGTIREQRTKIHRLLKKNPGLKPLVKEALEEGFNDSFSILEKETSLDLKLLPETCPYTFEQCVDEDFFPEG